MKLFDKLTTAPTHLRKDLQVNEAILSVPDISPVGVPPMADGYEHELRIRTQFWVDRSEPNQSELMHHQLQISKEMIIRHLYGDVLDQLLPIRRALANRDIREACKLVDDLQNSIRG